MCMSEQEKLIRQLVFETLRTKRVSASKSYMKKEDVRENLQNLLQNAVSDGIVRSQEDLEDWWETIEMAKNALRMVPFDAWKK